MLKHTGNKPTRPGCNRRNTLVAASVSQHAANKDSDSTDHTEVPASIYYTSKGKSLERDTDGKTDRSFNAPQLKIKKTNKQKKKHILERSTSNSLRTST